LSEHTTISTDLAGYAADAAPEVERATIDVVVDEIGPP
jgi:hypothetical protein